MEEPETTETNDAKPIAPDTADVPPTERFEPAPVTAPLPLPAAPAPAARPSSAPLAAARPSSPPLATAGPPSQPPASIGPGSAITAAAVAPAFTSTAKMTRVDRGALGAYEALALSPRLSDLVAIALPLLRGAAMARSPSVRASATDIADAGLARADGDTPFGNALTLLESGPENPSERLLAAALFAHVVAEVPRGRADDEDRLASDILWLAAHTPYDATPLLGRALGEDADDLYRAIADRVRRTASGRSAGDRAEAIVGAAAIISAGTPTATKLARELAASIDDPVVLRVLDAEKTAAAPAEVRFAGRIADRRFGVIATILLALTGILFVIHAWRLLARLALGYRARAEVSFSEAGVRIKTRREMLGRVLFEGEQVLTRANIARVVREVRYPRAALYTGLLALAVGSYVGVRSFMDGVRSASPSLLLAGIVIVGIGIGADFLVGTVLPGKRGRCQVHFVSASGATIAIADVAIDHADAAISRALGTRP